MIAKRLGILIGSCWAAWGVAVAQIEENPEFQAAVHALEEELPTVAADKLKRLYAAPGTTDEDRAIIGPKLLESLGRAGKAIELLSRSQQDFVVDHPATPFWRAVALIRLDRRAAAEQLLAPFGERPEDPLFAVAVLTRANLLVALQNPAGAREALEPLLENPPDAQTRVRALLKAAEASLLAGDPGKAGETLGPLLETAGAEPPREVEYLLARVALAEERHAEAEEKFNRLIEADAVAGDPEHHRLADGARLGLADSLTKRSKPAEAIDELVKFVNQRPESPSLGAAFRRLDELGFLTRPRAQAILETWLGGEGRERRAFAEFYAAAAEKLRGGPEASIAPLEKFRERFADHFLFPAAMLELGSAYVEVGRPQDAVEVLTPLLRANPDSEIERAIAFLQARARFEAGDFDQASQQFAEVAEDEPNAAFNRAVSALYAENVDDFQLEFQRFGSRDGGAETQAELMLERGLFDAAQGDRGALTTLREFIKTYPDHPRAAEAELALAELFLLEFPHPKPVAAMEMLTAARGRGLPPDLEEQADYAEFWIAASGSEIEPQAAAAARFFKTWENSPRRAEIRMKLGESYFGMKDYPNAQNQFELIANDNQTPVEAKEVAFFFAGKAASLSMSEVGLNKAIEHWGKVFDLKGPLAFEALRQQAVAKLKQNQPDQALRVLDQILAAKDDLDPRLKLAALMNVGQAHFLKAEIPEIRPQMLVAAIEAYNQIIETRGASRFWKNQAAVRKGRCLEMLDDEDQALETYFDVVRQPPGSGQDENEAPEHTWYYRAGFASIALLQRRGDWPAAVKMADRLAGTAGARAGEAGEVAKKLRLEHFIWDEPAGE